MMSTASMAHLNRKRPRGPSIHQQAQKGAQQAGLGSSEASGVATAASRHRRFSNLQHEVIDLDSDSENYIFKEGKRHKNVDSAAADFDADADADADAADVYEDALYDEAALYDEDEPYGATWFGLQDEPISSPYARPDKIQSPRSNSSSSTDSTETPAHILTPLSHSAGAALAASSSMRLLKQRKRTKSVPQLPYTRLRYLPILDRSSVLQKVGEVRAQVIQHQPLINYTYDGASAAVQRKFSFDAHQPLLDDDENARNRNNGNNGNYSSSASSGSSGSSSSYTSPEETPCDDKDGHYIVTTGSTFANDRFEIRRLLGQGTFGKVVKAYDRATRQTVAIKIIKAIPKYREASKTELRVLSMLKRHDPNNRNQCIHLRECFDYRDHICIVTDMLRISLYDFLEKNQFLPFPPSQIQAIARQLLRSVAFMHDLNLIHTDLKPENILLLDDSYVRKPYKKPRSSKVYHRKVLRDPKIYTIDFGSAIFDDEYHASVVSTRHYRAPEIVLGTGWSFPCDIWSVGCILVELLTGDALFRTHENVQHLAMMEKVIGASVDLGLVRDCISHFYHSNGRRRESRHSNDECIADAFSRTTGRLLFPTVSTSRKLVNEVDQLPHICDIIGSKVGLRFSPQLSLNESISAFKVSRPKRIEYKFWYNFIDLIRRMLVFDPQQRVTALQAMEHQWFDCGVLDDGIISSAALPPSRAL